MSNSHQLKPIRLGTLSQSLPPPFSLNEFTFNEKKATPDKEKERNKQTKKNYAKKNLRVFHTSFFSPTLPIPGKEKNCTKRHKELVEANT